MGYYEL
jgi:hypothetical protein